ncbi:hypothetical protein BN1723_008776 [Verticillium longisporum]|uniref:Uncharacterized protein n=1 Tax=Verticillium longisporum TaxID=100787 RepID=A0A0G4KIQ7_VERLO|nr:hypothetical protein BN1723_008776 [Verticillium longisporum]CRK23112.1 hypothetical protein BN1708_013623 [Verticillium longisporum]
MTGYGSDSGILLLGKVIDAISMIFVERCVVRNRETFIAWGRAIENWLHLPTALRPIYAGEPGLLDDEIRTIARWVPVGLLLFILGVPVGFDETFHVMGLLSCCGGLAILICVYSNIMAAKRRRILRGWTEAEARGTRLNPASAFSLFYGPR